jgi:hypothetical protein
MKTDEQLIQYLMLALKAEVLYHFKAEDGSVHCKSARTRKHRAEDIFNTIKRELEQRHNDNTPINK